MKRNGIYFKNERLVSKYYKQSDSSDRASNPGLTWKRNWVSSDHNRKKKKKEKRTKVMHWEVVWFQSTPSNPHISKHSRRSPACLWHCASPSRTAAFWCLVSNGGLIKKLSWRDLSREEPFVFPLLLAVLISTCLITSLRNMINGGYLCFVMECPA